MSNLSIKQQIALCNQSLKALGNLSDVIDIARQDVNNIVTVLSGFAFEEYLSDLFGLQEDYKVASDHTQAFINSEHIEYLDKQIAYLESRI
ncbi:Uncharacterised protein [Moraxella caprae]|uniref:Uncharacterized protein n=1 Tax=Moraxella caprae TaxID=90240 RepID=A0A378R2K6_9GAMM|nr:hypothetical protein [Moraxella caprae]STZ09573.1 Uncharacterised protein [Moraxella caprae]